jgi:hypothetical protein
MMNVVAQNRCNREVFWQEHDPELPELPKAPKIAGIESSFNADLLSWIFWQLLRFGDSPGLRSESWFPMTAIPASSCVCARL